MKRKGENSCELSERLVRAARASFDSNSISHVLREELRLSILNRRHANGQEALDVEFKKPKKYELSQYELEKKQRRREQNRRAARRCREKKKRCQEGSFVGLAQMLEENKMLEAEVILLRTQKKAIERFLSSHNGCASKHDATPRSVLQLDNTTVSRVSSLGHAFGGQSQIPNDCQRQALDNDSFNDLNDNLPQSVIEFCLEHSTQDDILLFDYCEDMRRQPESLSSLASDADGFGLDSDCETAMQTSDQSVLSESSEDEDVFQSNAPLSMTGSHASLHRGSPSYLSLNSYARTQDQNGCGEVTFMQYLNFAEP